MNETHVYALGMSTARYTHGHHDSVLKSHRWRDVSNSAAYLAPHLTGNERVLDVGCGPGTITLDLANHVASVIGVDLSDSVIEQAQQSAVDHPRVSFQVADLYALPFEDDSFDVVHAHQTLQHVPDPVAALVELRRVCRPGGLVAARDADYAGMIWYPADPGLDDWLALYNRCARANGGEPNAGRHLLAWAHAAGFSQVTPTASVWCHASPAERTWWGELWRDRILQSSMAEQSLREGFAGQADLDRISAAWQRFADHPDGWFTVPHGEILCQV